MLSITPDKTSIWSSMKALAVSTSPLSVSTFPLNSSKSAEFALAETSFQSPLTLLNAVVSNLELTALSISGVQSCKPLNVFTASVVSFHSLELT